MQSVEDDAIASAAPGVVGTAPVLAPPLVDTSPTSQNKAAAAAIVAVLDAPVVPDPSDKDDDVISGQTSGTPTKS